MRDFHKNLRHYWCPSVNIDKIWSLVGEKASEEAAKSNKVPVIDVTQ